MNEANFFDYTKPLFQDPPEDVEEDWSGFLIGGMAQTDEFSLARAYKLAADAVVAKALRSSDLSHEYAYPALFLYRHSIELYLKLVVQPDKRTHGITKLARQFRALVRSKMKLGVPDWVMKQLAEFAAIDPDSQAFRYASDLTGKQRLLPGEYWVSFSHLRKAASALASGFERAHFALGGRRRPQNG